jgi:hypothetical protein
MAKNADHLMTISADVFPASGHDGHLAARWIAPDAAHVVERKRAGAEAVVLEVELQGVLASRPP